ncbi:MAG: class I SAM-dependent methyltransferase [Polyangiaceae bacterium]
MQRASAQASGQKAAAKSISDVAHQSDPTDVSPPSSNRASPTFEAPEVFGREAVGNIARALPLVERVYANIRFSILRPKLLSVMDLMLTDEGKILDVGCGFGLFAAYFGQTHPRRQILGVDPNAKRIKMAQKVASSLGLKNHKFLAGDVRDVSVEGPFDAAYVLDVMHHIPEKDQIPVLERLRDLLKPNGMLLIKDITTEPKFGLKFTEYLDRLMVGFEDELTYRHHREWGRMLTSLGFKVRIVRVPDVLPYPHVVIAATKI